jgi:hypothetical protein
VSYVVAFARFWYDFIVGDSILLAIGAVVAIGGAALLVDRDLLTLAEWLLPAVVIATLAASLVGQRR